MVAILIFLFWLAVILLLAYGLYALITWAKLPEPIALIARVAVLIVAVALILGLFIPGLGVRVPGM